MGDKSRQKMDPKTGLYTNLPPINGMQNVGFASTPLIEPLHRVISDALGGSVSIPKVTVIELLKIINYNWESFKSSLSPLYRKLASRYVKIYQLSWYVPSQEETARKVECLVYLAHLLKHNDAFNAYKSTLIISTCPAANALPPASLKEEGNRAYKERDWLLAARCYTGALLHLLPHDQSAAVFFSNRSLCWVQLEDFERARDDAEDAIALDPSLVKCYRTLSLAFERLGLLDEAMDSCKRGMKVASDDTDLQQRMRACVSLNVEITRELGPIKTRAGLRKFAYTMGGDSYRTGVRVITADETARFFLVHKIVMQGQKALDAKDYHRAFLLFESAARRHSAAALYNLAQLYDRSDTGRQKNPSRMLDCLRFAASLPAYFQVQPLDITFRNWGQGECETLLANQYRAGVNIGRDYDQAVNWLGLSRHHGCYAADYYSGLMMLQNETPIRMIFNRTLTPDFYFTQAARRGHMEAQAMLAKLLETSNPDVAKYWAKKAAAQGSKEAAEILERIEHKVYPDPDERYNVLLAAQAAQGIPEALTLLGRFHERGDGRYTKDLQLAEKFYRQASQKGLLEATHKLACLLIVLHRPAEALEVLQSAARQGYVHSMALLGRLYAYGHGCACNTSLAKKWLNKAHKLGWAGQPEIFELPNGDDLNPLVEQIIDHGELLCEWERAQGLGYENLTLDERIQRHNTDAGVHYGFDDDEQEDSSIADVLVEFVQQRHYEVEDCLADLVMRAHNGSKTAQRVLDAHSLSLQAKQKAEAQKFKEALALWRQQVALDRSRWTEPPDEADAPVCPRRDEQRLINHAITSVLSRDPTNENALLRKAALNQFKKFMLVSKELIPQLESAVQQYPDDADFHLALAVCCMNDRQYERALFSITEAMRLAPNEPYCVYYFGLITREAIPHDQPIGATEAKSILSTFDRFVKMSEPDGYLVPQAWYWIGYMKLLLLDDPQDGPFGDVIEALRMARAAEKNRLLCFEPVSLCDARTELNKWLATQRQNKFCSRCLLFRARAKCACGVVRYCSFECQKEDWLEHKFVCPAKKARDSTPDSAAGKGKI